MYDPACVLCNIYINLYQTLNNKENHKMEVFLSLMAIPIMLVMSVGLAYYLIGKLLTFMETMDTWNRGDNC